MNRSSISLTSSLWLTTRLGELVAGVSDRIPEGVPADQGHDRSGSCNPLEAARGLRGGHFSRRPTRTSSRIRWAVPPRIRQSCAVFPGVNAWEL